MAACLVSEGVRVYATHGCSTEDFYLHIDKVAAFKPHVIIDDGCDLCVAIHKLGGEHLETVH